MVGDPNHASKSWEPILQVGGPATGTCQITTSKFKAAGLMAGAAPTATRAMALNFGMLAFNASAKVS